ncbi:MAG: polar amino acid transport system permease protein [Solirubrobacterales bacterium]|jgi:polar amino acid transport system permease protein|nr:polar amino acid transport system permease protein [Solirubrobacterales bacterium]
MSVFFHQYFDFHIWSDNFSFILRGFGQTLELSALSGALALIWGLILALLRQLPGRAAAPVRWVTIAYIDAFRGVPLLLTLLLISGSLPFIFTGSLRFIGLPEWFGKSDPFWYGAFAITLTYGAYMAEVYRAGIEAVPRGQMEAARSLGMSHRQSMRRVIVPQAIRKVIPPLLNDFIALMKDTSLVSVLSLVEVVKAGQIVQGNTFNSSGYTLGALFFLIFTIPLARFVDWLIAREQKRTQRGGGSGDVPSALQPLPNTGAAAVGRT